jgi:hypothetical protein
MSDLFNSLTQNGPKRMKILWEMTKRIKQHQESFDHYTKKELPDFDEYF